MVEAVRKSVKRILLFFHGFSTYLFYYYKSFPLKAFLLDLVQDVLRRNFRTHRARLNFMQMALWNAL